MRPLVFIIAHQKSKRIEPCRNSWVQGMINNKIDYFFVKGDPEIKKTIIEGDIVTFPVQDTYRALPQKTKAICDFFCQDQCKQYNYLLKCDDDSFVYANNLKAYTPKGDYIGAWSAGKYFSGGGYLLSRKAAKYIGRHLTELTGNEDQLVGKCLSDNNSFIWTVEPKIRAFSPVFQDSTLIDHWNLRSDPVPIMEKYALSVSEEGGKEERYFDLATHNPKRVIEVPINRKQAQIKIALHTSQKKISLCFVETSPSHPFTLSAPGSRNTSGILLDRNHKTWTTSGRTCSLHICFQEEVYMEYIRLVKPLWPPNVTLTATEIKGDHAEKDTLRFVHITQNGGHNLENWAKKHGLLWGRFDPYILENVKKIHPFSNSPWHYPLRYMDRDKLQKYKEGGHIFTLVRSPYTRCLAESRCPYYGLRNPSREQKNRFICSNLEKIQARINKAQKICDHFCPQYYYVFDKDDNKIIDHVIKFEETEKLWDLFREYDNGLGQECSACCLETESDDNISELEKKTIQSINQVYREDFLRFDYPMISGNP